MTTPQRRRGKSIPRLPPSAFSPPNTGTSDTFPLPPTPSLITPSGVIDAHRQLTIDKRAVVRGISPSHTDAHILLLLVPFALESTDVPNETAPLALTTTFDGTSPIATEAEDSTKDQDQVELPVKNLRWALQHARVIDLDINNATIATDPSVYDNFVNLLTKAIKSEYNPKRTSIVLTNLLPPPLDSVSQVVAIMNHPSYTIYRQRVSLLSLFENVHVKLLPPAWISSEFTANLQPDREKELRDILKLFIVPVLEAFGFERIIFGSSPASAGGPPGLVEMWYKLVLDSFRELAVSLDEMNNIFIGNAERVYG